MHKKCYNPLSNQRRNTSAGRDERQQYRKRVDPAFVDAEGHTCLHLEVLQDCDAQAIEHIIKSGCGVNIVDNQGRSALHLAVEKGNAAMVTALISQGADIEAFTTDGYSPLMVAGRHGKPEAIAALIEAGARVSLSNDKQQTALHFSVGGGCPRCVQQLLSARAKINYKDTESNTALILAAKLANPDITAMLLNERANPNIKDALGKTALHWAAETGADEVVRVLMAGGVDAEIQDKAGHTPFVKALTNNRPCSLQQLVDAGCDRTGLDGLNGTALCLATLKGYEDCVHILLRAGEDPDVVCFVGLTAVIAAASEGRVNIMRELLRCGADPNKSGRPGFRPLTVALRMIFPENEADKHRVVAMLLRANADVNARVTVAGYFTTCTGGRNCPLSFGICSGYISLVRMLLIAGCHVTPGETQSWMEKNEVERFFDTNDILEPIQEWTTQPVSLKHACRLVVRRLLGRGVETKIRQLPIAEMTKDYLNFEEFDYIRPEKARIPLDASPAAIVAAMPVTSCAMRVLEGTFLYDAVYA